MAEHIIAVYEGVLMRQILMTASILFVSANLAYAQTWKSISSGSANPTPRGCKLTPSTYTPNFGGVSGANAVCAAEFGTGYRMARTPVFVGDAFVEGTANRWVQHASAFSGNNCNNWTSVASGDQGYIATWDFAGRQLSSGSTSACNSVTVRLWCCNF